MSSNITAQMVASLREKTGLGMMECKKALVEAEGDLAKAEEILRVKSGSKASKVAGRVAAEGIVSSYISEDKTKGALVEVNCETDFVAKDENLVNFADKVAKIIALNNISDLNVLENITLENGKTVEQERQEIIAKLGENIAIRRFKAFNTSGLIASYIHGKKIGVMLDIIGENVSELGRDIAMHIAANKPICVSKGQVPQEVIESERNIYVQQAESSGKPQDIINKMVEGRISKYLAEVTLLGQNFVKNPDITIENLLNQHKASVNSFVTFIVGEGIEKKVVDFRAEVAAAALVN